MNVYILSDMEGTAGVSIWNQVMADRPEYQIARRWMTEEINAAAAGAFAAGAKLVLVNDCHLAEHNLDLDLLNPRIEYVMGAGKNSWTELDSSFDVLFQIGAHAKAGTAEANLRHTWCPANWVDLGINGRSVGEIGLVAYGAGELQVPCALVTGDDHACAEAARLIPGIVQATVKKGLGWQCARSVTPQAAQGLIRERAQAACQAADKVNVLSLSGSSVTVEILLLGEEKDVLQASRLEAEELYLKPLRVQKATRPTLVQAFAAALAAPSEPAKATSLSDVAERQAAI